MVLWADQYFQCAGSCFGREGDRFRRLFELERVRDQFADVQFAREDQIGNFFLQKKIGRIASDQLFLIDADAGKVQEGFIAAFRMGEKQKVSATAEQLLRLLKCLAGGNSDDSSVEADPLRKL